MNETKVNAGVISTAADPKNIIIKPASQDTVYNPGTCRYPEYLLKTRQNVRRIEGVSQLLEEDNEDKRENNKIFIVFAAEPEHRQRSGKKLTIGNSFCMSFDGNFIPPAGKPVYEAIFTALRSPAGRQGR